MTLQAAKVQPGPLLLPLGTFYFFCDKLYKYDRKQGEGVL